MTIDSKNTKVKLVLDDPVNGVFFTNFQRALNKNETIKKVFVNLKDSNKGLNEHELIQNDSIWLEQLSLEGTTISFIRFYISMRFYLEHNHFTRVKYKMLCDRFYAEITGYELKNEFFELLENETIKSRTQFL